MAESRRGAAAPSPHGFKKAGRPGRRRRAACLRREGVLPVVATPLTGLAAGQLQPATEVRNLTPDT